MKIDKHRNTESYQYLNVLLPVQY